MFIGGAYKLIFNRILLVLLILAYIIFSYNFFNGWWYSSIGTILILLFSFLVWGNQYLKITGLKIPFGSLLKTVLLALLTISGSFLLIEFLNSENDLGFSHKNILSYYHIFFYTLNEEIILGGIVIYFLYNKLKFNPFAVSVGLAIIFAVIHYVFYRWIVMYPGILTFSTITTLFFIGILRNNMIIIAGHIGYSWALHFGWMVIMFGMFHYFPYNNKALTEPQVFNLFLGSPAMFLISFLLAFLSTIYLILMCYAFKINN